MLRVAVWTEKWGKHDPGDARKKPLFEQVVVIGGGSYGLGRAIALILRASGGTFIQIASALSYRGIPLQAAYCSDEPKPTDSPDNLFDVIPGDPGPYGRFDDEARGSTAWTWLRLQREMFEAGLTLATMGLLAARPGRFPTRKRT